MTRALKPVSCTVGRVSAEKCWNDGAISSRPAGSAIQLCRPSMLWPWARSTSGVRSEWAMPRPAVIRFMAPGLISWMWPSLSRCMMLPSNR